MRLLVCLAAALCLEAATPNRAPLQPNAFNPLPLGSVMPKGWLLDQLKLQAAGLSGHLDEFWPDLGPNTAWLGGTGEGWERGPYFLDGLVPLAYLTKDPALLAKVRNWMDWTLDHQSPEGWIGPAKNTDWWPNYVMLKALMQYQEASGDKRVIPVMQKYFAYQLAHMDERPLKEWAIFRWHDEVLSVIWLYNRTGDAKMLELARKLHQQGHDWEAQFADFRTTEKVTRAQAGLSTHGVNNAMAMKAAAVWWLVTGDPGDRAALYKMFEALDRYHGQPNGIFSADEHFSGRDPSQGTELCAVVEAMFSLEQDLAILGDAAFGDRLEKIAYNALPATLSPDLWAHQYDQQANQIMCSLSNHRWATNGPESNIFGLEPNFGCCTANMHQGWPKLAANLWMATPDQGLAAVAYGPSEVETTVRGGVTVRIEEETGYPFRDTISLIVRPERATTFPLALRIPAWASGAAVTVRGAPVSGVRTGEFLRIEREWRAGDRVEMRLPMALRLSTWYNNSVAVERGPLVYSLRVGENWHKLKQTGPASDWEIYPTTPWNYGLVVDPKNPAGALTVKERPLARQPYTAMDAPIEITAKARRVPQWGLVDDSPGPLPVSPVTSRRAEETVTLVPYGAAKLRITAFPFLIPGQEEPPKQ
jgi:hypothetical protein